MVLTEEKPIQQQPIQPLLTPEQVAQRLNITLHKVLRMMREKQLPAAKIAGEYRMDSTVLEKWISDQIEKQTKNAQ